MSILSGIFGRRVRLPRDHVTRVPRAAKRKAADALARMTQAIDDLGAMPGIADIASEKRVPRGFYDKVDEFVDAYAEYERVASERFDRVTVSGLYEISWWVLGYGDQAEVIKPVKLRRLIAGRVANMAETYRQP